VKIIAIEEHWNSVNIRDALDRLQNGARDESVAFNTMGDNQARLEDIGQGRVEAMDAAGIDVSIMSVVTPATRALSALEAIALAREANDEATDAVRAHPARFRAFATLPTSDPQAAAAELERCATQLGHVGAMIHGRTGTRTLDDPAYDDLFATAARLHQPIFIHPQIPSNKLRDAAYRGLDPLIDLGLASFGWGWHMDAGPVRAAADPAWHVRPLPRSSARPRSLGRDAVVLDGSGRQPLRDRETPRTPGVGLHHDQHPHHQQRDATGAAAAPRPRLHRRRPGAVLHRLPLPPARRGGGRAILRCHPRPLSPL
jgi:hypothetical protein